MVVEQICCKKLKKEKGDLYQNTVIIDWKTEKKTDIVS